MKIPSYLASVHYYSFENWIYYTYTIFISVVWVSSNVHCFLLVSSMFSVFDHHSLTVGFLYVFIFNYLRIIPCSMLSVKQILQYRVLLYGSYYLSFVIVSGRIISSSKDNGAIFNGMSGSY